MARHLRIYRGPQEEPTPTLTASKPAGTRQAAQPGAGSPSITVSVGEVLPLLADAVTSQRTWLQDFEEDEMTISADLYEVLLAYQYFRRPSA